MRKNTRKFFTTWCGVVLLIVITTNQISGSTREHKKANTTVCEIVAKPHRFNKKVVKLRGFVKSDMIEHTVLLDSTCQSQGISLWVSAKLRERSDFEQLYDAISREGPSTTDRLQITGTFTGVFHYYPKRSAEKRVLEATSVEDIEVKETADRLR